MRQWHQIPPLPAEGKALNWEPTLTSRIRKCLQPTCGNLERWAALDKCGISVLGGWNSFNTLWILPNCFSWNSVGDSKQRITTYSIIMVHNFWTLLLQVSRTSHAKLCSKSPPQLKSERQSSGLLVFTSGTFYNKTVPFIKFTLWSTGYIPQEGGRSQVLCFSWLSISPHKQDPS